jgi:hypothetical protein
VAVFFGQIIKKSALLGRQRSFIYKTPIAFVEVKRFMPVNDSIIGTIPAECAKLREYVGVDFHITLTPKIYAIGERIASDAVKWIILKALRGLLPRFLDGSKKDILVSKM